MSEETTENFWSVIQSFEWPEPDPVSYRLYHDDQGRPLFYTMEHCAGSYVEVDQATYIQGSYHVVVRDGKLIHLQPRIKVSRLAPDTDCGTPCHPQDLCLIVSADRPHQKWKIKTNDCD